MDTSNWIQSLFIWSIYFIKIRSSKDSCQITLIRSKEQEESKICGSKATIKRQKTQFVLQRHDQVTLVHLNSEQFNPSFNQMKEFFSHVNTDDILMKAYVSLPLYYII